MLIIFFLLIVGIVFSITSFSDPQEEFRARIEAVLIHLLSIVLIFRTVEKFQVPLRFLLVILLLLNIVSIIYALIHIMR